jgi:4-hydroxy-4-methyl-2-oxoglutarate aldolase
VHKIVTDINRPNSSLVTAFEGMPSSVLSDVTPRGGLSMDSDITPVAENQEMVGTALTVKASPGDNLIIHKAMTLAEPGDVLVIDGNGHLETAYMGEIMCASCKANSLAGAVVDGAIRDQSDIRKIGFPLFAKGVNPRGPDKAHPGSVNVTVSCGGVSVEPGDIVVGDSDGVAVVISDNAEEILEVAQQKLDTEEDLLRRVNNGEFIYDIYDYEIILQGLDDVELIDSSTN